MCRVNDRDRVASNRCGRARALSRGDGDDRRQPGDQDHSGRSREPGAPPPRRRGPSGSPLVNRKRLARGRQRQPGVVAEDRLFERPQLQAGLDPDLLDQPPAPLAVALECIGLASVAVERQHQLTAQLLVERLSRDGPLEVGNQLVVASEQRAPRRRARTGRRAADRRASSPPSVRPPRGRDRTARRRATERAPRRTPSAPRAALARRQQSAPSREARRTGLNPAHRIRARPDTRVHGSR